MLCQNVANFAARKYPQFNQQLPPSELPRLRYASFLLFQIQVHVPKTAQALQLDSYGLPQWCFPGWQYQVRGKGNGSLSRSFFHDVSSFLPITAIFLIVRAKNGAGEGVLAKCAIGHR